MPSEAVTRAAGNFKELATSGVVNRLKFRHRRDESGHETGP